MRVAFDRFAVVNDEIVAVGRSNENGDDDALVVVMPSGGGVSADTLTDIAGNDDEWRAVTVDGSKIITAGETDASSDDFIVGRYKS